MTTERDDMDAIGLLTEGFPPGDLRTAALGIDRMARRALAEVEDPDLFDTISHFTIAIIGILCHVRDGMGDQELLRTIDRASALASAAAAFDEISMRIARGRMN